MMLLIATAQAVAPAAPSDLSIFIKKGTTSHTYVALWTDNSTNETSFVLEERVGMSGAFAVKATTNPNTTGYLINQTSPLTNGTTLQFQVRALNGAETSPASNLVTFVIPADSFATPSTVTTTAVSESVVHLSWTDNSTTEDGVEVELSSDGGASFFKLGDIYFYQKKSIDITELSPGTTYKFRLRAYKEDSPRTFTAYSSVSTITTNDVFTSRLYQPITLGTAFSYQAAVTTGYARSSWSITGLPAGLSFNSTTGIVSGVPTVTGVFTCPMSATFANGWTSNSSLTLRIIRAASVPVVAAIFPGQTLMVGGNASIPLTGKFADPDSESAVRVTTNLGVMDFILYNTATPQTVANFLGYVNNPSSSGNFNGAVFHRSVPGFILQGGAFKTQSAPNNFSVTTTTASPVNEPGISNLRGTVAMAKLGNNPNSASDQFFVNLADNSGNLDNQNGGFTAFARVAGNGMAVADTIAGLPNATYNVNLGGTPSSMDNWPLTSASAAMDISKVIVINSAAPVAVLSHSVTGNTNPSAVSASINGANLQIDGLLGGQSDVTVTATDLDGNTVSQTFSVMVNQSPTFTSTAPTAISDAGITYSYTNTAGGFPVPTFSITSGALPTGLVLNTNGAISGIPSIAGIFTGEITATNPIGTAKQSFSILIRATLANWAAGQNLNGADALPNADPDFDGRSNLEEFAFFTNPNASSGLQPPTYSLTAVSTLNYAEVTFPVRKFAPSLTYTVETSNSLSEGTWSTLWTSADGFNTAAVSSAVDQADRTILTIRDSLSSASAGSRFLRVKMVGQ